MPVVVIYLLEFCFSRLLLILLFLKVYFYYKYTWSNPKVIKKYFSNVEGFRGSKLFIILGFISTTAYYRNSYPNSEDLAGARDALLRLQETFQLPVADMIDGISTRRSTEKLGKGK